MNDRQMFKSLNGIDHKDEDIKEYIDLDNISDKKISSITNDVKTKLAKEKFSEACIHVKEKILERDEVIEKIIKATDSDILMTATVANLMINAPFMTGDGYSFNALLFCTNKRIIVVNANYYNRMQGIKIYNKEEIKEIMLGEYVKKKYKYKFSLDYKKNKKTAILKLILRLFSIFVISRLITLIVYKATGGSQLIEGVFWVTSIAILSYLYLVNRRLESELLIEFSNGKFKDLLIRNLDCDEIQEYLSNKYK